MVTKTKTLGLTGNQLKLLALLLMTIDHMGIFLFPGQMLWRCIGRLAMPIFAWMIAEGCTHTRNRLRYLLTLAGFAALCQVVYWVTMSSLDQCIFVTFSLSVVLIYALDYAVKKKSFFSLCVMGAAFVAICYICLFLPGDLPNLNFSVDYGILGVLLPVAIYIARSKEEKLLAAAIVMTPLAMRSGYWQWFSFLSLPLLALYNGQRGKWKIKYLFYCYYPLHLVILYGIGLLLAKG